MLKNNQIEIKESGKMLALTMALTNFLLLAVVGGISWLVQLIFTENNHLTEIARGFILQ
jgi:hypothetical protein